MAPAVVLVDIKSDKILFDLRNDILYLFFVFFYPN